MLTRRNFLKMLGVAAAAPALLAMSKPAALLATSKPARGKDNPLFLDECGEWDGVEVWEGEYFKWSRVRWISKKPAGKLTLADVRKARDKLKETERPKVLPYRPKYPLASNIGRTEETAGRF